MGFKGMQLECKLYMYIDRCVISACGVQRNVIIIHNAVHARAKMKLEIIVKLTQHKY